MQMCVIRKKSVRKHVLSTEYEQDIQDQLLSSSDTKQNFVSRCLHEKGQVKSNLM